MTKTKKKASKSGIRRQRTTRISKNDMKSEIQQTINEANAQTDPLSSFPPSFLSVDLPVDFLPAIDHLPTIDHIPVDPASRSSSAADYCADASSTRHHNDTTTTTTTTTIIQFFRSPLPHDIHQSCLDLFELNMGEMYRQSSWGLNVEEKSKELEHEDARFLVILAPKTPLSPSSSPSSSERNIPSNDTNIDDSISSRIRSRSRSAVNRGYENEKKSTTVVLGFAHFRYEIDDDDNDGHHHPTQPTTSIPPSSTTQNPVTYLYELQIHPSIQSRGLGKRLVSLVELISLRCRMKKVMLTVFQSNVSARNFYGKKMKYVIDECSPSNFGGEENEDCDYEIMSKALSG